MSVHRRIPKRPRFYVGCEGQSEVSYIALIRDFCEDQNIKVTVDPDDLSSGDPLSRVKEAIRRIKQKEAGRETFKAYFLLLDNDQAEANKQKAEQAIRLAKGNGIKLIWQRPCHEGFLLRHFAGHEKDLPANAALAEQALLKVWPEYSKPMDKRDLSRKLALPELARAKNGEPAFAEFLSTLGLALI
jgi:RloB-like protein